MNTDVWDAVVIGAGPAGSLVSQRLATRGYRILVIDKEQFPRPKVCGGCLGAVGATALREASLGLGELGVDSVPLQRVSIHSGDRQATLPLSGRRAIHRCQFDARLLDQAVRYGTQTLIGSRAKLGCVREGSRDVEIAASADDSRTVRARLVITAAGLGADRLLPSDERPVTVRRSNGRVGAGATVAACEPYGDASGVTMACGRGGEGYVGIAPLPGEQLDIAAAFDPRAVSDAGGTAPLAAKILRDCDLPVPEQLLESDWRATPTLTQRPTRLGAERVLLIGDAAGYVEPFTGEGIGWALRSALEVESLAVRAIDCWQPSTVDAWTTQHAATLGRWQRRCRAVCNLIGGRWATPWVVGALASAPWLARPVLRQIDPAA